MAATSVVSAAATSAAPAPVLAPNKPKGKFLCAWLFARPKHGLPDPRRQQWNIEHVAPVGALLLTQQIKQKRRETAPLQGGGDLNVTRTEAARSAAMRENHQAPSPLGKDK